MRLGEMNNLSAEKLNENMQQRVGWNFGNLSRLTMAQATEMLETVDSKLQTIKTNNLHESEKNTAYNGMMLAKQVLETFISEATEEQVDEARSLAKKGDYEFINNDKDEIVEVKYKNKTISTGDFDRGADGWFMSIKGQRGQKFFRNAIDVVDYFDKNNITESVELDESTAQGVMEDEVGQAESLMAAQDMVDSVQGMLEDVGEMINEKLPPLTDSLCRSSGADSAATFNQQTNEALNTLMDAVRGAREAMANAVGTLTGQEPTPMGNTDQELDLDTATDDSEEFELDDFETSDAAQGGNEPLGRAKRD